ncbi:MAG: hypothetical protein DRG78_14300 [Epsilonproteobacteria bacterium]|nr:MAG: hypothetical protein DRG78_14300 [Campylobacterota bacterium]
MSELMKWFKSSDIWASVDAGFTIVSIIITFGTFIMVIKNYLNNKKQTDKIEIIINRNNCLETLPTFVLRKDFTRSEVFGILGALDSNSKFDIKYTSDAQFIENIFNIQKGVGKELIIKIEDEDKFDWHSK